jgi:hypothetical protein
MQAFSDFVDVNVVVDSAKCHAYSFTAEARSRTDHINARSLKPRKKRRGAYPNRWNSCFPASDRQDREQSTPSKACSFAHVRNARDTGVTEALVSLTIAPPRCPIRRESMDIEELQNNDLGSLLSLHDSGMSDESDTDTDTESIFSESQRLNSTKAWNVSKQNTLCQASNDAFTDFRFLMTRHGGSMDQTPLSPIKKVRVSAHTA